MAGSRRSRARPYADSPGSSTSPRRRRPPRPPPEGSPAAAVRGHGRHRTRPAPPRGRAAGPGGEVEGVGVGRRRRSRLAERALRPRERTLEARVAEEPHRRRLAPVHAGRPSGGRCRVAFDPQHLRPAMLVARAAESNSSAEGSTRAVLTRTLLSDLSPAPRATTSARRPVAPTRSRAGTGWPSPSRPRPVVVPALAVGPRVPGRRELLQRGRRRGPAATSGRLRRRDARARLEDAALAPATCEGVRATRSATGARGRPRTWPHRRGRDGPPGGPGVLAVPGRSRRGFPHRAREGPRAAGGDQPSPPTRGSPREAGGRRQVLSLATSRGGRRVGRAQSRPSGRPRPVSPTSGCRGWTGRPRRRLRSTGPTSWPS